MSRVQLALNVSDVDAAVAFYTKLFGIGPAKRRPGYANFAITEPALKLVLIESAEAAGTLNHLGVELESVEAVTEGLGRLRTDGLDVSGEGEVTCCYALQDKGWVHDPDGAPWELYTVLADADSMRETPAAPEAAVCCAPTTEPATACC